jgi:ABC-type transport system substrate-binding protein
MNKTLIKRHILGVLLITVMVSFPSYSDATVTPDQGTDVVTYATPYQLNEYSNYWAQNYGSAQWLQATSMGLLKRSSAAGRGWIPALAAAMPTVSEDKLTFTFELKQGLVASDGSPITAEDVAFSYKTWVTPDIAVFSAASNAQDFDNSSVTVIDDYHLSIKMLRVYAFVINIFGASIIPSEPFQERYDNCLAGVVADCTWNNPDGSDAIGTGPFMVETVDTTQGSVTVKANPNYYDASEVYADRIIYSYVLAKDAAISQLAAEELDIFDSQYKAGLTELDDLGSAIVQQYVGAPSNQIMPLNHKHPVWGTGVNIPGNTESTPLMERMVDAAHVRKAMSMIVDRNYAVNTISEGLAGPAATFVSSASLGWDPSIPYDPYNITAAKEEMTAAGFDYSTLGAVDGEGKYSTFFFTFDSMYPTSNPLRIQWAQLWQGELAKIGIGHVSHPVVFSEAASHVYSWSEPSLVPLYAGGGYDNYFVGYSIPLDFDMGLMFSPAGNCATGSCENYYNFDLNAEFTDFAQIADDYQTELDFDARNTLLKEWQELCKVWTPLVPILYPQDHWAWQSDLSGVDALMMSITAQEWDLVTKTGFTKNVVEDTDVSSSKKDDSPISGYAIMAALFASVMVVSYSRRYKK